MKRSAHLLRMLGAAFVLSAATVACGGSTGGPTPQPPIASPTVAPTAPPIPTSAPFTASQSTAITAPTPAPLGQTPAPISVPLPSPSASAGISGAVAFAAGANSSIPAGTHLTQTLTNQQPSGIAPLSTALRSRMSSSTAVSYIAFVGEEFSEPVTLSAPPSFTFALSSSDIVAGATYYMAFYDPMNSVLGWQLGFEGPATVNGSTLSFTGAGAPMTFAANEQYWFGLYAVSALAPTPTPAPSMTPVPSFGVSQSSVSFTAAGQTAAVVASGVAPYTASGNDKTIATVSSSGATFTITAVAAGTTSVTIDDAYGRTATIPITVTTTSIPIQ